VLLSVGFVFGIAELSRHFLFPQKKVTKENSRLRLLLLVFSAVTSGVVAEPDDADFEVNGGLCF